jgi:hypothetical protein
MGAVRGAAAALALAGALAATLSHAFKLQALGAMDPGQLFAGSSRQGEAFMRQFTLDVHERITRRAYEEAGVPMPDAVIAGIRWNDNPPAIRLVGALAGTCGGPHTSEGMSCWTSMMRVDRMALEAVTRREWAFAPVRSHFGDMQFLHAMASREGEPAEETRRSILRWSEFAWRVARGEIHPKANVYRLRRAKTGLADDTADWVSGLFSAPEKKLWTVQELFEAPPPALRPKAFGTLLHLVEDAYSDAHVSRDSKRVQANGCLSHDGTDRILQFRTYAGQDAEKHGVCDDAPDWLGSPRAGGPIEVLAEIVRAYHEGRDWLAVKEILESKVFGMAQTARAARPGRCFDVSPEPQEAESPRTPIIVLDPACRREESR